MSTVIFVESYSGFKLKNKRKIKKVYEKLALNQNKSIGEVSVVLVTDNELLEINRKYLNHDYYTDIITFDYCEGDVVSGDLMVSLDMIKFNAQKYSTSFDLELLRVLFHGFLHLVGFKDKTVEEAQVMRVEEEKALSLYSGL